MDREKRRRLRDLFQAYEEDEIIVETTRDNHEWPDAWQMSKLRSRSVSTSSRRLRQVQSHSIIHLEASTFSYPEVLGNAPFEAARDQSEDSSPYVIREYVELNSPVAVSYTHLTLPTKA